jgi:putative transposase
MTRDSYPTDLTDKQWEVAQRLIPPAKPGGRSRSVNMREILNAIFYYLRSGCQWRMLPHEFPPWGTVAGYYRTFRRDGTWKTIHDVLRERVREAEGRNPEPSAAVSDSQSVKTTQKGGRAVMTPASM